MLSDTLYIYLFSLSFVLSVAFLSPTADAAERGKGVQIHYFGHACFMLKNLSGTSVLIDPYTGLDYPPLKVEADIVLITHEHFDHNAVGDVTGNPVVIHGLTKDGKGWNAIDKSFKDVHILAFPSYHDRNKGADRGKNTIFLIHIGGLSIAHLGDIGYVPTKEELKKLPPIDILLIPVGGFYTIEPEEADEIAAHINPRILIPMHYKTKGSGKLPIKPLDVFLKGKKNVEEVNSAVYVVSPEVLPKKMKIVVLQPR